MKAQTIFQLSSARDTMTIDTVKGVIVSYKTISCPNRELLSNDASVHPLFLIHYLDHKNRYRELNSSAAFRINSEVFNGTSKTPGLKIDFHFSEPVRLGITVLIQTDKDDRFLRLNLGVKGNQGLRITDIVFPVMVFKYNFGGTVESESIIFPFGPGKLYSGVKEEHLLPDSSRVWNLIPEMWAHFHYPGDIMAQFLAHYDDSIGIFISCDDEKGYMKRIQPLHRGQGVHLGFSHIGDWPERGDRMLEYSVKVSSFTGDWYDAAEIYRDWTEGREWTNTPLSKRKDIPAWLMDSPPAFIVRLQGLLDDGPAQQIEEFLPYTKIISLLEPISRYLESPVVPMIMTWENPGPWVYPECLPPVGGAASLEEFCGEAAKRNWHIGSFCNGTRWVTKHWWTGYDGEQFFEENGGKEVVCRLPDNSMWKDNWDFTWRESFTCCLGVEKTKTMAIDFIKELIRLGLDWIQFLDQNNGCAAFPCFSKDHGHPPIPGRWMITEMIDLLTRMRALAEETLIDTGGKRRLVYSVERPVNELLIPYLPLCDIRVVPPGHVFGWAMFDGFVPLYHFLYHPYILIQGGFGTAPEPYHLQIRNTYNLVIGEVPGAVLQGDGKLLAKDTVNWARWEPDVGSNDDALFNIKAGLSLRKGLGKDFLVFGKMLSPAEVRGIGMVEWQYGRKNNRIPAVFHSSWRAPDGRSAVILGNWTDTPVSATLRDPRLGSEVCVVSSAEFIEEKHVRISGDEVSLAIPALGFVLVSEEKK